MTRSTPPFSAYDEDFFSWTQEQAVALRRSAGHMLDDIDVEHLAEEIEDLGKRDLREVTSFLELLLGHLLKIEANSDAPSVPHWRLEIRAFRRSAVKAFSPGIRRLIDMSDIWSDAANTAEQDIKDLGLRGPASLPCPFELDDLLSKTFDIDGAIDKIARNESR